MRFSFKSSLPILKFPLHVTPQFKSKSKTNKLWNLHRN